MLKFDLDITGIPKEILEYIKANLVLNFCHADESMELKNGKERDYKPPPNEDSKTKRLIGYRKKIAVTANMIPDIMYTPFEILNLIITVEVPHIEIWEKDQIEKFIPIIQNKLTSKDKKLTEKNKCSSILIKFNIMDYPE